MRIEPIGACRRESRARCDEDAMNAIVGWQNAGFNVQCALRLQLDVLLADFTRVSRDETCSGTLLARNNIPDSVLRLINPHRRLLVPDSLDLHPHPKFLRYHRDFVFKS